MIKEKTIKNVYLYKPNEVIGYIEIQRKGKKSYKYYYNNMSYASIARLEKVLFEMTIKNKQFYKMDKR